MFEADLEFSMMVIIVKDSFVVASSGTVGMIYPLSQRLNFPEIGKTFHPGHGWQSLGASIISSWNSTASNGSL
jgi:hypothetical protein